MHTMAEKGMFAMSDPSLPASISLLDNGTFAIIICQSHTQMQKKNNRLVQTLALGPKVALPYNFAEQLTYLLAILFVFAS